MAIATGEIEFYKSETVDDSASNGGRMAGAAGVITSGAKNNVWPNITQAERTAGLTRYRKVFVKIANDADLIFFDCKAFVETYTGGDDNIYVFLGTQTDIQSDLTGSERLFGAGQLTADIAAGVSTFDVTLEDGGDACFVDADLVRISDKLDVNDSGGNEEYLRLLAVGGVSIVGDVATLTLDTGVTTTYAYLAADTRVASVIEVGDVQCEWDTKSISSAAGTYDEVTYPPVMDNIGTIEQTWTFTFTSANNFDVVGDVVGSVGSGNITTDFTPNNPDFTKPYFTLDQLGWGGTWAIGDTLSFKTHPAAVPMWRKEIVPAATSSYSGNQLSVAVDGESE